jgi:signal transduction histidine kinase/AmiR/NasT family two-component response regulator
MRVAPRFLLLEDDPNDTELIRRALKIQWPDCELVHSATEDSYERALKAAKFDLVLCDYCLPGFGGLEALELVRERQADVPLIFVSGGIGEEIAIAGLKAGATDYVLKDHLNRLVPAVRRALKERAERLRRKRAEARTVRFQNRLVEANRDLMRRNQEIQSFYHTLSHELKTPLTAAREFVSIVLEGLAGPLAAKQREYLTTAQASCEQLRLCIDDLLDSTRLETGKMALEFKMVSIGALARETVRVIERQAHAKGIRLRMEIQVNLAPMAVDEHRITQVILNLLNNAIKYTPANGVIRLEVREACAQPEVIEIAVSDTGCGIPKEEHLRIFDRLYQVHHGDAASEQGIGLGLYLCRELARLHGGSIRVDSEVSKGSTFTVSLPRTHRLRHGNVLVIDDDADLLEMIELLLASEQYDVHTAHDGEEGLRLMRKQPADLIILDLQMPRLSGPETLKQIRHQWGAVPVILHTAFADGELMKEALAYSPFTLLTKPSTTEQILHTVRKSYRSTDTAIWKRSELDAAIADHDLT